MKVGVVGCGSIGRRYVEWLAELGAEVGACDLDMQNLDRVAAFATSTFTDATALLDWGAEKVVISTPPLHHLKPALLALGRGVDVLIEKPLAANLEDARQLVAAAENSSARAWVVCNMRFHPAIQAIAAHLNELGRPLCARAYFSHRLAQMRPAGVNVYASSTEQGGGVILDCIHEFDVLQWLLGPMKSIRGWCDQIGEDNIQADDIADLQIAFENGCHGILHFDFLSRMKRRGFELIGNDATVIWESRGKAPEICNVNIGTNDDNRVLLSDDNVDGFAPYREMLNRFLTTGDGLQSIEDACATLRFALAAFQSEWNAG